VRRSSHQTARSWISADRCRAVFERFLNGEFGGFSHGNPNSLFLTDPGFAVLFEKAAQNDAHGIGGMR
jgi:hypothetical protein